MEVRAVGLGGANFRRAADAHRLDDLATRAPRCLLAEGWTLFAVKLDHTGTFQGKCTEFCGLDHDRMLFTVKVMNQTDYDSWLSGAKQKAAAGKDPMYSTYDTNTLYKRDFIGETQRSHQ